MKNILRGISLTILILGCNEQTKKDLTSSEEIQQIIMNFQLIESVNGITNFFLKSDKAFVYDTLTVVQKVELDFYKEGTVYAKLTADSGILFVNTNDMCAYGNVKVVGVKNATLETNLLNWANEQQLIYTDSSVVITRENKPLRDFQKITGKCFESDPGLINIKLKETHGYSE